MAKNYVQPAEVIDFTAAANVSSGSGVAVGVLLGVALGDVATGDTGRAAIEGGFELPKLSTAVITRGASLIWDISEGRFIITSAAAGDLVGCAVAIEPAGNGDATVVAKLIPGNATVQGA